MRRVIRRFHIHVLVLVLAFLARDSRPVGGVEICGNGVNDDPSEDNLLDEGCNPEGYLGVRESPLPRGAVGIVAPISGQQVWTEPADLHANVAYGPNLEFVRSYNSQVNESGLTFAPMGPGWRHNYQSWLQFDSLDPTYVRARLTSGEDVLFTYVSTTVGYAPQTGHHVGNIKFDQFTSIWSLTTHDGWKYSYSGSGTLKYLDSITDPRGNSLTLTYTSGRLTTVAAATGAKELRFTYRLVDVQRLTHVEYWADGTKRADLELTYAFGWVWGPQTAKLGSAVFRNFGYDANGKLTQITDASGHTVVDLGYVGTAGQAVRALSGKGMVANKQGASCNGAGSFYQYFNLKDNGAAGEGFACDTDAQCVTQFGSGHYCGGQTTPGTGTSGLCFRARRCVTTTTSGEDLVKGASSVECPSCVDVADRSWDATTLTLKGQKDPDNVWTSYLYNSDGYVTKMVENDSDDNANAGSVPGGARVTWFFYSSTFPSLVTEVRRKSELSTGTCDDSTTTGCKRTITTYTTGGQVDTIQEIGFTYDVSGAVTSYSYTTDYDYDTQGRVTQVNGPRTDTSYDIIQYTYWSGAGNLQNGHLKEVKRQKNASTFITTTYDSYDYWGNAGKIVDPNAKLTCLTYDGDRNVLITQRVAMAGQTTCTSNAADLVTTSTYDSALNLTKMQYPEGNCIHYEYDSRGRLSKVKSRDDCNAASTGDTQEFTYDDNGNLIKTEFKDSSGTVTKRQEKTFGTDGRVAEILNPANTAKKKTLAYKVDGMLESISGEDAIGKTEWAYDNFNRTDAEKRYKTSSTFDTWDLTPGVQLDLPTKVQDDDTKHIDWVWDDMGRKVKQVTPDAGTTILVYDAAGNLTDRVDAKSTADEKTHHFGFDSLNRLLGENWGDPICFTLGGNEIQHYYDDETACPTGTCANVVGRPSRVQAKIRCDISQLDDNTFDQWTYFKYDDAGRLVQESIRDDGGRVADQYYAWDKNGNVTKTTAPSGYYQKSVFGTAGNNSDKGKLVEVDRGNGGTDTVLTDSGKWYPFGPMKEYRQSNTISGNKIMARLTWDLGHRPSNILYERETNGTDIFRIAYTLDAQGRVTIRDFTGGHGSLQDAYYTYDWQNRVTCDSAASGACPTSGTNVKSNLNSSPPYSASSDRKSIIHKNGTAWPLDTFTYTLGTGKDQISSITKSNSQVINFGWDTRGNRLYDDDAQFSDDRRDYVYDARDNLVSVSGKMISGSTVHNYTESNAFDHKNRRVFKSLLDTTAVPNVESQYFYYYDLQDRLIEVKYTPNITDSSTYQIWQLYWIGNRPVAIFQTTYPGATLVRRFVHADDLGTPLELYSWPTSGDAARAWAINPDAFGWGNILAGPTAYEPLRFPGQMCDEETTSVYFDTATSTYKILRPPLSDNRYRVYDPFTASYLQSEPMVTDTWNSYAYGGNNPVMMTDTTALLPIDEGGSNGAAFHAFGCGGAGGQDPSPPGGGAGGGGGGTPVCTPTWLTQTEWLDLDDPADQFELAWCGADTQLDTFWNRFFTEPVIDCMCDRLARPREGACSDCKYCSGAPRMRVIHWQNPLSWHLEFQYVCGWECYSCMAITMRPEGQGRIDTSPQQNEWAP